MSEWEGLIKTEKLIQPGREISEPTIIALEKQRLDHQLARSCLRGTLAGALVCLVVIGLIVASPVFTTRNIIQGWEIVAIVVAMIVVIVIYGVFIFNRAMSLSGKLDREGAAGSVELPGEHPTPRPPQTVRGGWCPLRFEVV
ncbi:MAG TPA: hypothetical protein VFE41_10830 [Acetobacteraceae bacterium]|jgi:hypothetical protein|nr:hypothetical protein [Acetobacteraceae bacterium]